MKMLRKHTAKLKRYSGNGDTKGYYNDDGEWVSFIDSKVDTILCCIQPDFQRIRQLDKPEGVSEKDCRIMWTHTPLQGTSELSGNEADIIIWEDKEFEVHEVSHWMGAGKLDAYEALLVRKDKL